MFAQRRAWSLQKFRDQATNDSFLTKNYKLKSFLFSQSISLALCKYVWHLSTMSGNAKLVALSFLTSIAFWFKVERLFMLAYKHFRVSFPKPKQSGMSWQIISYFIQKQDPTPTLLSARYSLCLFQWILKMNFLSQFSSNCSGCEKLAYQIALLGPPAAAGLPVSLLKK